MRVPLGYQQLALTGTAQSLTMPNVGFVFEVDITVEVAAARWRDDGTAPTAAIGMLAPISSGSAPWVYRGNPRALQFILATGAVGTIVNCEFYGRKN